MKCFYHANIICFPLWVIECFLITILLRRQGAGNEFRAKRRVCKDLWAPITRHIMRKYKSALNNWSVLKRIKTRSRGRQSCRRGTYWLEFFNHSRRVIGVGRVNKNERSELTPANWQWAWLPDWKHWSNWGDGGAPPACRWDRTLGTCCVRSDGDVSCIDWHFWTAVW